MKFLAIEHEVITAGSADFQPHLKAEAARAWELYKSGCIRELYFRPDLHTAVLMLECTSAVEAQELVDSLPLVSNGLISFEIIPLVAYTGFARLFETNKGFE